MAAEKTPGIVLKVVEFSETSCVVTIFTRDFGKITGLAKGARRRNSPFEAAIDVLSLVRLVFLLKSNDALDLLTEAKLERRFRAASVDLGRFYAGQYVIELLGVLTINHDPMPALYDLAERAVIDLDEGRLSPDLVLNRFEMRALHLVGHQPQLESCVNCNRPAPRVDVMAEMKPVAVEDTVLGEDKVADEDTVLGEDKVLGEEKVVSEAEAKRSPPATPPPAISPSTLQFGLLAGGLLCRRCRPGHRSVVTIAAETSAYLQRLAMVQSGWERLQPSDRVRAESRQVLNQFVSHTVGFRPKAQAFLHPQFMKSKVMKT